MTDDAGLLAFLFLVLITVVGWLVRDLSKLRDRVLRLEERRAERVEETKGDDDEQ